MKRLYGLYGTIALCLFCVAAMAGPATASIIDATCRITADKAMGTGCVFEISQGTVYVLTAAHVVPTNAVVKCEFWRQGHQSAPITGKVLARGDRCDVAFIALPEKAFGGLLPGVIALGNSSPKQGEVIRSVGCPDGRWPTEWQGRILSYSAGEMRFLPPPLEGRSGSPVFDAAGTSIVGVIVERIDDERRNPIAGVAIPIADARQAMQRAIKVAQSVNSAWHVEGSDMVQKDMVQKDMVQSDVAQTVQYSCNGGCPGNSCGNVEDTSARRSRKNQPPTNPWPTVPTPAMVESPSVDLSPIERQLDGIQSSIQSSINNRPVQSQSDPAAQQALGLAGQAADRADAAVGEVRQLRQDVPAIVGNQIKPVADVIGPLVKLHAKLEADAEAGGLKGKLAQKVLEDGDKSLQEIHKEMAIVGAVLLVGGLIAFCVLHLILTGRGPIHQLLQKMADKHPDNQPLQAAATASGNVDANILAAIQQIKSNADASNAALAQQVASLQNQMTKVALQTPVGGGATSSATTVTKPVTPAAAA